MQSLAKAFAAFHVCYTNLLKFAKLSFLEKKKRDLGWCEKRLDESSMTLLP